MTEHTPLSQILNDEEPIAEVHEAEEASQETAEQQPEEEAQTESTAPLRDEKGRFVSKGEEESAPPAPQEEEPRTAPIAALRDERSKRQALEQELAQLRAQYAQPQPQAQPAPQQEQGPPDRWEDPEGYDQWLINKAAHYAREQAVHAVHQQRIYTSAVRARAKYEDYDQAHQVFGEMAQRNPSLMDQMLNAEDPAEFAYNEARHEIAIRSAGGLQAYIQQEAARLAAEQAAQAQPNLADVANRLPSAPPTISNSRSTAPRGAPQFSGPTPLSDILS